MKLICERDALSSVLSHVASRARNKLKVPILQHVLLDATAANKLAVRGTDLATQCIATCPAEIETAGSVAVPADHLARLIDGLPQGAQIKIDLRHVDLHVECGRSRYKLPTMPATDFPEMSEVVPSVEFELKSADAKRVFGDTSPAVPNNDTRIFLFGGYLSQPEPGHIMVTTTDGLRLVRLAVKNAAAHLDRGYIVPKPTMPEIVKLATIGDLAIRFSDAVIDITAGNVRFTSKLVDGTYPDMDKNIPAASGPSIKVDRAEFMGAFKRLTGLEDENSTINFRWKTGGQLEMSLIGSGSGAETVGCECEIADGEIAFRPSLLGSMLDVVKGEVIDLIVTGPNTPMRIYDPNDPGLSVIAMPCKGRG